MTSHGQCLDGKEIHLPGNSFESLAVFITFCHVAVCHYQVGLGPRVSYLLFHQDHTEDVQLHEVCKSASAKLFKFLAIGLIAK